MYFRIWLVLLDTMRFTHSVACHCSRFICRAAAFHGMGLPFRSRRGTLGLFPVVVTTESATVVSPVCVSFPFVKRQLSLLMGSELRLLFSVCWAVGVSLTGAHPFPGWKGADQLRQLSSTVTDHCHLGSNLLE